MSSLYELVGDWRRLQLMAEDDEVDAEALVDTMEGIAGELEIKAGNYVKIIRQIEADADMYLDEAARLKDKAEKALNKAKRMKEALMMAMQQTGFDQGGIKTDIATIKISGNGGLRPLVIDDQIPDQFMKMVPQPDNKSIRAHLEELEKAGLECTWAHLEDRGKHLSIK